MKRTKFDIPEIPWELVDEARRRTRLACERRDLDLCEPALSIGWDRPEEPVEGKSSMSGFILGNQKKMIEDPVYDLRWQLVWIRRQIEHLRAGEEVGMPLANHFSLHMLHFGTGPLATAFGSTMIVRDQEQPSFEPAIHTPEEAMRLRKPDLRRAGILPDILKRIDFYNESTGGKVPMTYCDTGSPWSIGTQLWHYEDMLEATYTAPEAVHHFLGLITDCIIEWHDIQKARIGRWTLGNSCVPENWFPRGTHMGDDCMVTVSPEMFDTFFLPYNNRISRAFGGLFYHCCMRHDFHFEGMARTEGFLGMDADLLYNDVDKIFSTLDGRGVYCRKLDIGQLPVIRRMKGHVGCFLHAAAAGREDAISKAKLLLAEIEGGEKVQRYWRDVGNSIKGEARFYNIWTVFLPFDEKYPPPGGMDLRRIPASLTIGPRTATAQAFAVPDGRIDLASLGLTGTKATAYVYIPFTKAEDGPVTLGIGADWWYEAWVDGKPLLSTLDTGNGHQPPGMGDHWATVDLRAGEHLLAVRLLRGVDSAVLCVGGPAAARKSLESRARRY